MKLPSTDVDLSSKKKIMIILALAVPAMVENILQTVVGFVDMLFVSKLGLTAVTAVGVANAVLAIYIALFTAIGVGASAIISQAIGANDLLKAKDAARTATVLSLIVGMLLGIGSFFFAAPLLRMMGAEGQVLQEAVAYFRIVSTPSILIALMFIFGSILRASGDTRTPMNISLIINLIHIPLDAVFIFGFGRWEGLGIEGAAWATVVVRLVGTILFIFYLKKSPIAFSLMSQAQSASKNILHDLLKLATPTAIERLVMRLGQVLYFGLILKVGTTVFAAHSIAGNIETFAYMPGYGLAIAATTLVGQHVGAKQREHAYEYGVLTAKIAVVFMSVVGLLMYLTAPWFAAWFTEEATAQQMVVTALRIDAFAQPALAIGLVIAGALQGASDTKSPMYSTLVGMWGVRVLGVYVLGIVLDLGIAGIWLAIAIDLLLRALFLSYRFNRLFNMTWRGMQKAN